LFKSGTPEARRAAFRFHSRRITFVEMAGRRLVFQIAAGKMPTGPTGWKPAPRRGVPLFSVLR